MSYYESDIHIVMRRHDEKIERDARRYRQCCIAAIAFGLGLMLLAELLAGFRP